MADFGRGKDGDWWGTRKVLHISLCWIIVNGNGISTSAWTCILLCCRGISSIRVFSSLLIASCDQLSPVVKALAIGHKNPRFLHLRTPPGSGMVYRRVNMASWPCELQKKDSFVCRDYSASPIVQGPDFTLCWSASACSVSWHFEVYILSLCWEAYHGPTMGMNVRNEFI